MGRGSSVPDQRQADDGGDGPHREPPPLGGIGNGIQLRYYSSHQLAMPRRREFRHALDDAAE